MGQSISELCEYSRRRCEGSALPTYPRSFGSVGWDITGGIGQRWYLVQQGIMRILQIVTWKRVPGTPHNIVLL